MREIKTCARPRRNRTGGEEIRTRIRSLNTECSVYLPGLVPLFFFVRRERWLGDCWGVFALRTVDDGVNLLSGREGLWGALASILLGGWI